MYGVNDNYCETKQSFVFQFIKEVDTNDGLVPVPVDEGFVARDEKEREHT